MEESSGWFGVFGVGLVKLTMVYLTRGFVGNTWLGFSSNGWNDVDSANRRKLEAVSPVCLTTFMGSPHRLPRTRFQETVEVASTRIPLLCP